MNVAISSTSQVGVRELKNNLSRHLERVKQGDEVIVTDHGHPVARLIGVDRATDNLAELVAAGVVTPPATARRHRSARRVTPTGSVSDLVDEQRR